jgi:hypothetical protein
MNEAEVNVFKLKCPECGGELELGFIQAPRGIYWDTKERKWISMFSSGELISTWRWTTPRVQA